MHLIENKGVKSECMKFGENSRQMPSVSTICDEYCSYNRVVVFFSRRILSMLLEEKDGKTKFGSKIT